MDLPCRGALVLLHRKGMANFFRNRILNPLLLQLKAGITPQKLATSVAIGAVVGTFPVLGSTTLLGLASGLVFRLNHLAVQVALNVTYPLQLLFLIPLLAAGGSLLHAPVPASLDALQVQFHAGVWATLQTFAMATVGAILVWLVVAVPLILLLRIVLLPALTRLVPPAEAALDADL